MSLTREQIDANKEKFLSEMMSFERDGVDRLLEWLVTTDFYEAPSSTMFHGCYPGGLVEHSLNVLRMARSLSKLYTINPDSLTLAALMHDVCKADVYHTDYRNKKNEYGQWERVPFIKFEDSVPLGHGEKSAFLVQQHVALTLEEVAMIRWHMGSQPDAYGRTDGFANACRVWPAVAILHTADMLSAFILEREV